ncbi:hypothetical protein QEG73_05340 [Chitinophagaceae bacterium 26-R-25]|nr:hypothetical protein [Chitinophagaceae bacterium 26-R-25]
MKTPILVLLFCCCCSTYAQKRLFVRVYDLSGKKIDKGRVLAVSDSTVLLETVSKTDTISARNIGSIRTRRAAGHNIAIGMTTGGVLGAIFGAIAAQPVYNPQSSPNEPPQMQVNVVTPAESAVIGLVTGLAAGALVGTLVTASNRSVKTVINGDPAKWKEFQMMVADYNARHQKKE